jgi:hypothetical protein
MSVSTAASALLAILFARLASSRSTSMWDTELVRHSRRIHVCCCSCSAQSQRIVVSRYAGMRSRGSTLDARCLCKMTDYSTP